MRWNRGLQRIRRQGRGRSVVCSRVVCFLFLFGVLFRIVPAQAVAIKDGDWQYWNYETIEIKVADRLKLRLDQELRFADNMGKLYYEHTEPAVVYELQKWLSLDLGYRSVLDNGSGKWVYESMPFGILTPKWSWNGFDIWDKNRLEYRIFEDKRDMWRYRQLIGVKLPCILPIFNVRPFVSNEFLITMTEQGYNENRLSGGVALELLKNLKGEIYYMWRADKKASCWTDRNILGTKLKFSF